MLASRWPKKLPFVAWATHSEIVLARAKKAEGPYHYEKTVLPAGQGDRWDNAAIHNPNFFYHEGTFLCFYCGTHRSGRVDLTPPPEGGNSEDWKNCWNTQRIGVAWTDDLNSEWKRSELPLLEPRSQKWDAIITSNPAASWNPLTKQWLLYYKSISLPYSGTSLPAPFELGVAAGSDFKKPFTRLLDHPLFPAGSDLEDPFVWHDGQSFHMLAKDMTGSLSGEKRAGVHAISPDGLKWAPQPPYPAYSRHLQWPEGEATTQDFLERPHYLPSEKVLFFATAQTSNGTYTGIHHSFNVSTPFEI